MRLLSIFIVFTFYLSSTEAAESKSASSQYLALIENFVGWAEQHWNEKDQSFNAKGSGVTWARGNGDVCLCYAILLAELPERKEFCGKKIPRDTLQEHLRLALRTHCL